MLQKASASDKEIRSLETAEVLVIHLKRFSYTQFTRNKLETLVDFPIMIWTCHHISQTRANSQTAIIACTLLATTMEIWEVDITLPASIMNKGRDGTSLMMTA